MKADWLIVDLILMYFVRKLSRACTNSCWDNISGLRNFGELVMIPCWYKHIILISLVLRTLETIHKHLNLKRVWTDEKKKKKSGPPFRPHKMSGALLFSMEIMGQPYNSLENLWFFFQGLLTGVKYFKGPLLASGPHNKRLWTFPHYYYIEIQIIKTIEYHKTGNTSENKEKKREIKKQKQNNNNNILTFVSICLKYTGRKWLLKLHITFLKAYMIILK